MTQWVKVLTAKSDHCHCIPDTSVAGDSKLPQVDTRHLYSSYCIYALVHPPHTYASLKIKGCIFFKNSL